MCIDFTIVFKSRWCHPKSWPSSFPNGVCEMCGRYDSGLTPLFSNPCPMVKPPLATHWASAGGIRCFSTRGDWPGKKTHKHCFELSSFYSSGDRINFTCWLSATDRSGTKCKSCSGALEISLGFHTAQTPLILPVTIALPIFSFIQACRKHLDLWRWKVRHAAHP